MIKKILSGLLVSSVLLFVSATNSMAMERPTVAIGGTMSYGGYLASGQETEGATNVEKSAKKSAAMEVGYSSVFFELTFADRLTLGMDYMTDGVTTDLQTRVDSSPLNDDGNNEGTSTIKAEFADLTQGYIELRLYNGFYAKYASMEIDVLTKEALHTDSSYPDKTIKGEGYGFGFKNTWDNGIFIKTETMLHNWDSIKIDADHGGTDTDNENSVSGTLQGAVATLKIGKQF
jgi:hypothetical protein